MHLSEILKPDMVWPDLTSSSKSDVIRELARNISVHLEGITEEQLTLILEERERLGSTGIQDGIAIPHGKIQGLKNILIACGRSKKGVDFDAHDAKPTHLFFVLLAPELAAGQHLKALARLSRLLKNAAFREKLLSATDSYEIYSVIINEDERL